MGTKTIDKVSMFLAELLGTAMLIFLGCMGCLSWNGQAPSSLQSSFTFGMVVMLIIQSFGCVSGAHLNPAVTLAALVYDMIDIQMAVVYFFAQLIGAYIGYGLLMVMTPTDVFEMSGGGGHGVCVTAPHPGLSPFQAVTMEYLSTTILILICGGVWDPRNAHQQDSIPVKFGFAITAIGTVLGPFTSASMNPARSLAPAIWQNDFTMHWIYWLGPLPAGIITAIIYKHVFRREVVQAVKPSQVTDIDRKVNECDCVPLKTIPV
ncbi:aquaporin AQPAn.G-like [Contarinia nasturtii]|uniref:aquaporin AQPAn.G-like n=1 Tax=Contarinia nasturtii TaxID=265458 RepID=UPI0012D4B7DF|nr:aquaporin AQPAn.G-like [Contarinia nasturtii]XP_031636913.1 aquaporin AQPAn.G-like [Contarinia nasturtii]XP_031636915.1 aquaporin AQPAn.G-like [Contarinia nasturtii]XP_031636916.1 aquaporin AQPAn.G-like [Contarinia nasturtii]XP_031636917.1 aquaporin AQPAn.G-like [Contarinia nasturtii]XP_031636918.1 aquaporin AQPAn.G-like [Contarinia nasturtii]XP_031636919.1 aquaporin AQPAn.G-like [Contarinia nasturtii]